MKLDPFFVLVFDNFIEFLRDFLLVNGCDISEAPFIHFGKMFKPRTLTSKKSDKSEIKLSRMDSITNTKNIKLI